MATPREELNQLRALAVKQPQAGSPSPREELNQLRALAVKQPQEGLDQFDLDVFSPTGVPQEKTVAESARAIGGGLGLEKAVDPFARSAARVTVPEELKTAIPEPTAGELVGGGLQLAALALPFKAVAGGATALATKVVPTAVAKVLGSATAGALGGFSFEAGEKIQRGERPVPGLMTLTGAAIPGGIGVISETGKVIAEKVPARIINSLIKPLLKNFSYGKNPGRVVAEEKIVANSFDDLVSKISSKRTSIGGNLGDVATVLDNSATAKGAVINLSNITSPLDKAIKKAASENNQELINRLSKAKQAITEELITTTNAAGKTVIESAGKRKLSALGFKEALAIKRNVGDMTKFTGNISDDEAVNKAFKTIYGEVKEAINKKARQVDPGLSVRFSKLNEKYADITSADIAARYRDKIIERHNIITLKGHFGAIGGAMMALISSGGAAVPAVLAGVTGATLDKALGSTAVKTRIAAWLAKATPAEKLAVGNAAPNVWQSIVKKFKGARSPGDVALEVAGKGIRKMKFQFQKKIEALQAGADITEVFTPRYIEEIKLLPPGQGFELVEKFEALKRAGKILPEFEQTIQKLLPPGQGFALPAKTIRRPVTGASATPTGEVTFRR